MKEVKTTAPLAGSSVNPWTVMRAQIAPDGYSATVTVHTAVSNAAIVYTEVLDFLKSQNIVYGIIPEAVKEVVATIKNGIKDKVIVVAKGEPLEEGKDGCADYKFNTKLLAGKMDNKRMDFKERGYINNVSAGKVIAMVTPEIPGKPGMRVDGEVVHPRPCVAVRVPTAGPHVAIFQKENTVVFTAQKAGHARLLFDEIQVNPDLVVSGDIDFGKGNIDFVGNIQINGSVRSGFSVNAGGDIVIHGDVEPGAVITAGKNITVRKNINCGKGPGKIVAGGNVSALRISNSLIECNGSVFVKDSISDSIIRCDGKFATKYGKVFGCRIEAVAGIIANTIGLEQGTSENHLHAGVSFFVANRLKEINTAIERCEHDQALLIKQVVKTSDQEEDTDHTAQQNIARAKLAASLKEELDELRKEKAALLPRMKTDSSAQIVIQGWLYPSCFILIGKKEIKILDAPVRSQTYSDSLDSQNTYRHPEQTTATPK